MSHDRGAGVGDVVGRYARAWQEGDVQTLLDCYADDIVLHWFGRSPLAGDHAGKGAALEALAKMGALTNRRLVEIHDVLAGDGHGAILARERFERDGRAFDADRVLVYHVRNGRLSEVWVYDADQRTVDDFLA